MTRLIAGFLAGVGVALAAIALLLDLPLRAPGPEPEPLPDTVHELRALARERLGSAARPGGRRISQARKADLLAALMLDAA